MKPTKDFDATLVDLLERILDKGIVLHADVIIHVAGIPLLGLSLKACIAGMETMLRYGIWNDWDEAQRIYAIKEIEKNNFILNEKVFLKTFVSILFNKCANESWKSGFLYITSNKLIISQNKSKDVLIKCFLTDIDVFDMIKRKNIGNSEVDVMNFSLKSGDSFLLHSREMNKIKSVLDNKMNAIA